MATGQGAYVGLPTCIPRNIINSRDQAIGAAQSEEEVALKPLPDRLVVRQTAPRVLARQGPERPARARAASSSCEGAGWRTVTQRAADSRGRCASGAGATESRTRGP